MLRVFVTAKGEDVVLILDDVFLHYLHGKLGSWCFSRHLFVATNGLSVHLSGRAAV